MKNITGHSAKMWGPSIIDFDEYHYKYDSGREGDMPKQFSRQEKLPSYSTLWQVLKNMTPLCKSLENIKLENHVFTLRN
jgi:hypothetical protein